MCALVCPCVELMDLSLVRHILFNYLKNELHKIKIQHHFQTYGCNATPQKYCGGKNDDVTIEISHGMRLLSTSGSNSFRLKIYNPSDVNCKYKHFLDLTFNVNIF